MSDSPTPGSQDSNRETSIWWLALPLLVVAFAFALLRGPGSSTQPSPAIGKPAPQIDLVRLGPDTNSDRFQGITNGEVTLIHFWGTWCGPCKVEYPELDEVVRQLENIPEFRFLSVSCEGSSNETIGGLASKTAEFLRSGNMQTIAYADPKGVTRRSVAERLGLSSIFYPTSILVGRDGNIADVWLGYTPESVRQIESKIQQRLAVD